MAYTDPKTGNIYPSREWMLANKANLPEVQAAYPDEPIIPPPSETPPPPETSDGSGVSGQTPSALGLYEEETPEEKAIREAEERQFNLSQVEAPNEEQIRANTLAQFQSQIDALDTAAASKKADLARTMGITANRRVGSQRALMAGAGMLGQVSGEAERSNLEAANAGELKSAQDIVDAETAAAKATLLGQARTEANTALEAKRKAYSEGADALVTYLKEKAGKKTSSIDKIIKAALLNGIDLTNAKDVAELAKTMGVSVSAITDAYKTSKSAYETEQAAAKTKADKETAELSKTQAESAKIAAETYKLQHPDAVIKEVGGGLYDVTNGKWIVERTKTKEEIAAAGTPAKLQGINDNIDQINSVLYKVGSNGVTNELTDNPGLKKSAQLGLDGFLGKQLQERQSTYDGDIASFISGVEKILSQGTLKSLIDAKAQGATFGALSDRELGMLASSFSQIGTWRRTVKSGENTRVIGYNVSPEKMKEELLSIQEASNRLKAALEQESGTSSGTGTGIMTSPDGTQQVNIADLSPEQIQEAKNNGWK